MKTAGGIQEDEIIAVFLGIFDGGFGDVHRIGLPHLEHRDPQLRTHGLQLIDGSGTVDITGRQQRVFALLFHISGQFRTVGGLAGALQAHQHHEAGRLRRDVDLLIVRAHEGHELFVDDLDDLLRRVQRFQDIRAHGPFRHVLGKVLDDFIADVRFQKCQTHFPHRFLDVGIGQPALASQLFKSLGQLVR